MKAIFFDDSSRDHLLPLTFTRPISELRVGILTISEKWSKYLETDQFSWLTLAYLSEKYPFNANEMNLMINGSVLPDLELIHEILKLKSGQALWKDKTPIAAIVDYNAANSFIETSLRVCNPIEYNSKISKINYPWNIFSLNEQEIEKDFHLITKNRKSKDISDHNQILQKERIFVEESAIINFVTINPCGGYVYIGKDAEIMEASVLRGSVAVCDHAIVKASSKIYGATTLGPQCRGGGEIHNSVLLQNSNKGHDGFLGNSVLGEWCNLGADTNNSNLKNNYAEVKVWNYVQESFIKTGLTFCGLIMGDHSKCGINTMFNTGTVVGVSANIFGSGFPRNFIPSYSWGGASGFAEYKLKDALKTAEIVMKRRNLELTGTEVNILQEIFSLTQKYRRF